MSEVAGPGNGSCLKMDGGSYLDDTFVEYWIVLNETNTDLSMYT